MTVDSNNTNPPQHIFWLFIVHMLKALGPVKGRQVLADTTDLLRDAKVWPHVLEDVADELSDAYVYACGLKDCTKISEEIIEYLKYTHVMDHIMSKVVAGDDSQQILDEVNKLKAEGYISSGFHFVPLSNDHDNLKAELSKLGYELDEPSAAKGCNCSNCERTRAKAENIKKHGYDPTEN